MDILGITIVGIFFLMTFAGIGFSFLYEKLALKKPIYASIYNKKSIEWVSFGLISFEGTSTPGIPLMLSTCLLLAGVGYSRENFIGFLFLIPPFILCQIILWRYKKRIQKRILFETTQNYKK